MYKHGTPIYIGISDKKSGIIMAEEYGIAVQRI
jgi:hypothetical protein